MIPSKLVSQTLLIYKHTVDRECAHKQVVPSQPHAIGWAESWHVEPLK